MMVVNIIVDYVRVYRRYAGTHVSEVSLTFRFDLNLPKTGLSFGPSSFFFGAMRSCATRLFLNQILGMGGYSHNVCPDGNALVMAVFESGLVH